MRNDPTMPKLLIDARTAAEMLSICEKTLYSMSEPRGPIPVVRLGTKGKAIRYSTAALQRWIEQQQQSAAEVVK